MIKGSAVYKATGGYGNTPYMQMEGKPSRVRTESWLWYNGAITVDGAASFKVADQGAVQGGNAQIRVYVRRLEATGTADEEWFDYLTTPTNNPDINDAAYSGNWILTATTEVTSPAGAFVTYSTLNYQIPSTWEGSAVRIRINNSLVDGSSNSVPLYVDNARVREL